MQKFRKNQLIVQTNINRHIRQRIHAITCSLRRRHLHDTAISVKKRFAYKHTDQVAYVRFDMLMGDTHSRSAHRCEASTCLANVLNKAPVTIILVFVGELFSTSYFRSSVFVEMCRRVR